MRTIASIIVGLTLPFTFATAAEAGGRVDHNYSKRDVCKNFKGRQTVLDIEQGFYQFKNRDKRVCVKGWR